MNLTPAPSKSGGKARRLGCRGGDPITAFVYLNGLAPVKTRQIQEEEGNN